MRGQTRCGLRTCAGKLAALACLSLGGGWAVGALPPVPVPPQNPISEPKRVLGKALFWEEQLSITNTTSCGTCHTPQRGGIDVRVAVHPGPDNLVPSGDDKRGSPGVPRADQAMNYLRDAVFGTRPQATDRTSMSMIDAAYAPNLFWDGRASSTFRDPLTNVVLIPAGGGLESQAVHPPVSSVEMAHDGVEWAEIVAKLEKARPMGLASGVPADVAAAIGGGVDYPELFRRAFGDKRITPARIAMALATYQRTLIADQTPWDRFDAGDVSALTPGQIQGLNAFNNSNCNACHVPPLFTGNGFRNIGLRPPGEDLGRQLVTGDPVDRGRFKVPSLRNVGLRPRFMHNGQFTSLTDVIRFYARAPGAAPQFADNRDPIMQQVNVPPQVAPALQDFIQNGLTDPRVASGAFPFDKPVLASERPETRAISLGGGVTGSGLILPRALADMPAMVGSTIRLGVDAAMGGRPASVALSDAPPVNGRVTPDRWLGTVVTSGTQAGSGVATVKLALNPIEFPAGRVFYVQWFISDPGAPGGEAASDVLRLQAFCPTDGCPSSCPTDLNADQFTDTADFSLFAAAYNAFDCVDESMPSFCPSDFNGDRVVDNADFQIFAAAYFDLTCP